MSIKDSKAKIESIERDLRTKRESAQQKAKEVVSLEGKLSDALKELFTQLDSFTGK